ncbi:MAG: PAS domain S-box protein [bacterium]|nr:PAS domain S-box protein [bacterium]
MKYCEIPSDLQQEILYHSPIGIYTIDKHGKVDSFNPKMMELAGVSDLSQVIGLNTLTSPSYKKAGLVKFFKEGLKGKPFFADSIEYYSYTTGKRSVRTYHGVPLKNSKGRCERLLLLVQDVTDKEQIMEDLRMSEENYRTLYDLANDGIIKFDEQFRFVSMNKKAVQITGYIDKEIKGKNILEMGIIAPSSLSMVAKELKAGLKSRVNTPFEFEIIKKDGRKIWVELSCAPISIKNKVVGVVSIVRDCSVRKELSKMRAEFISIASHQLQTPLSAIKLSSELFINGYLGKLNKEQSKYIKHIDQSSKRAITLVNNLLKSSQIEQGRIKFAKKPVALQKLIAEIIKEEHFVIDEKDIQIVMENKVDKTPLVNIDPAMIRIVIQNIISNAIKYNKLHGKIIITSETSQRNVIFAFEDTGVGIPDDQQKRVFTEFFRAENVLSLSTVGTGLGLSIAKQIVELSGGDMWLDSIEGKGTKIYISIPKLKKIK